MSPRPTSRTRPLPSRYLLDRARKKLGSDYKIAKPLGVAPQYVSDIRRGRKPLSPYHVAVIAELLGERWTDHVLPALAAKATRPSEREYWLGKLRGPERRGKRRQRG